MNNQSNNEIIKATREFRDVMTADTAIIEIAKMLSSSADRLDVTTAALREMTKKYVASVAAERVWEATMMEACGEDGPGSVASKFKSLRKERDALAAANERLAAENVALKSKGVELCSEAASVYSKYNKTQMPDRDLIDMQTIQEMHDLINGTPAAATAEIRAQGVDEMASEYRKFAQEDGCSCNMQSSYNLTAERAESYAAYIRRKGTAV